MSESENIARVVAILGQVPVKSLKIIELANSIPIHDGEFDPDALARISEKVDNAWQEAGIYQKATSTAISQLRGLMRGKPETDDDDDEDEDEE